MKEIKWIQTIEELEAHIKTLEFESYTSSEDEHGDYKRIEFKEPFLVCIAGFRGNNVFLCKHIQYNDMVKYGEEFLLWSIKELDFYNITDEEVIGRILEFVKED